MYQKESILEAFRKSGNTMTLEINLHGGLKAIIDAEDMEKVSKYKWWVTTNKHCNTVYVAAHLSRHKNVKLHRLIMGAKDGQIVDHINGCGLDNRKINLRFCTQSQNLANSFRLGKSSSKYRGVAWSKEKKKWAAKITVNYKQIYLGRFVNEEDAARAYDCAAKKHFGGFACLNLV